MLSLEALLECSQFFPHFIVSLFDSKAGHLLSYLGLIHWEKPLELPISTQYASPLEQLPMVPREALQWECTKPHATAWEAALNLEVLLMERKRQPSPPRKTVESLLWLSSETELVWLSSLSYVGHESLLVVFALKSADFIKWHPSLTTFCLGEVWQEQPPPMRYGL